MTITSNNRPTPGEIYSPFATETLMAVLPVLAEEFAGEHLGSLEFKRFLAMFDSPALARYVERRVRDGTAPIDAFQAGLKKRFEDTGRRLEMQGDPKAIFKWFSRLIRESDDTLYLWKYMLHSDIARRIDFSEDAFTVTYPIDLLRLMAGISIDDAPVNDTVRSHAVFLFGFALQLMLNELACPQGLVGAGQQRLHVLRQRRLFEAVEERSIYMVFARDRMMRVAGAGDVSQDETPQWVEVFETEREADRYIKSKENEVQLYKAQFLCRVIKDKATNTTFFVSLNRRNKRSASRQLKNQVKLRSLKISEFDKEFFKDGVGSRYAVIAILNAEGELRPPTRKEIAEWFLDIVRQRLWSDDELTLTDHEITGQGAGNKYKSCHYWDCKLHGFLSIDPSTRIDLADHADILPCVLVEEILMTGWDFLSSVISIGDDNHGVRLPLKLVDFFTQQLPADILKSVRDLLGWRKPVDGIEPTIYRKWLQRVLDFASNRYKPLDD